MKSAYCEKESVSNVKSEIYSILALVCRPHRLPCGYLSIVNEMECIAFCLMHHCMTINFHGNGQWTKVIHTALIRSIFITGNVLNDKMWLKICAYESNTHKHTKSHNDNWKHRKTMYQMVCSEWKARYQHETRDHRMGPPHKYTHIIYIHV